MTEEPMKVMLVEDNLGDARLLYECLKDALPDNFEMAHVRQLSEALEWLWTKSCDVVLLDLGLPDTHGLDTLILTRDQAPKVPIVVLTGYEDEALGAQAIRAGAQDYLVKGQIDARLLSRSIRYAIERKRLEDALVLGATTLTQVEARQHDRWRLVAAQEHLRKELASYLRSEFQQRLLLLRARMNGLLGNSAGPSSADVLLRQALEELERGLIPALESLLGRFADRLSVDLKVGEELAGGEETTAPVVPRNVGLVAYRIVEEVLRSAEDQQASNITLRLAQTANGQLCITAQYTGRGLVTHEARSEPGSITLEDYVLAAGGESKVRTDQENHQDLMVILPLPMPKGDGQRG